MGTGLWGTIHGSGSADKALAPYRALYRAALLQALIDLKTVSAKARRKREQDEADAWFDLSRPDFLEICDVAEYAPEKVMAEANFMRRTAASRRVAAYFAPRFMQGQGEMFPAFVPLLSLRVVLRSPPRRRPPGPEQGTLPFMEAGHDA
jgi:hypothetical protein